MVTVNDYLATRDAEWMGRLHRWLGLTVGRVGPESTTRAQAGRVRRRHDLRHEHRVRLRLPARQHGAVARAHGPARPRLRHRRRGRLHPHRRGPHAAHHLGPGRRGGAALLPVRLHRPHPRPATSTTRSTRRRSTVVPLEAGIEKVEQALGVDNLYDAVAVNYVHQLTKALAAKELYHRDKDYLVDRRRGEDRRRVHRPHARRPALVRGSAPGGRGQGAGAIKEENHTWPR